MNRGLDTGRLWLTDVKVGVGEVRVPGATMFWSCPFFFLGLSSCQLVKYISRYHQSDSTIH